MNTNNGLTQFRKKPVVIGAVQWFKNGDHPMDYSKTHDGLENGELRQFSPKERRANGWEGDVVRYYRHPDDDGGRACQYCGKTMHMHGWIDTKEGGHIVCPGDWIITGVQGEHYPCKPDIFAETYEPAAPGSPASTVADEGAKDLTLAQKYEDACIAANANARDAERWRKAVSLWRITRVEVFDGVSLLNAKGISWDDLTRQVDAARAASQQGGE